jgi:polysaccharide biosynthesis protein PslA
MTMNEMSKLTTMQELEAPVLSPRKTNPVMFELSTILLRVSEIFVVIVSAVILASVVVDFIPQRMVGNYMNAILIAAIFYAGLAEVTGVYDVDVRFSLRRAWGRVLVAWFATSMFMLTLGFLSKTSEDFSRGWAISWFVGGALTLCGTRALTTIWLRSLKRRGVFDHRVAIFGANKQGNRLAKYILGNERLTIDLVGFFDDRPGNRIAPSQTGLPLLGNMKKLTDAIRAGHIDQVIIALPWSAEKRLQEVVNTLSQTPIRIRLAPDLVNFSFAQRPVVLLGDLPVMTLFERPISGFDQISKRLEDLGLSTLFILMALPFFALIALAIKLDSPGPVFFRQPREGYNNAHFRIWKFRSMRTDDCEQDGITQATKGDSRITRVGAILRRTSIDELPQLFNVFTGEMSLVGPRPHAPSTKAGARTFSEVVSTYATRHKVKPGITGWAQVCGWRGETDTEEKLLKRLEHDLHYIENWSIFFDLYIMLRTLPALASSKAY